MTLQTHMAKISKAVFMNRDLLGEAVTYTPVGGSAISRTVVIERNPLDVGMWEDGTGSKVMAEIFIANDVVSGITDPGQGDAVAFDGRTFGVTEITNPQGDGIWKLLVVRVDVDEKGGIRAPGR